MPYDVREPIPRFCPVHGDVDTSAVVFKTEKRTFMAFCSKCYAEKLIELGVLELQTEEVASLGPDDEMPSDERTEP